MAAPTSATPETGGRGFTLVECLIVLALVAVLAGLAVPGFQEQSLRMARLDAVQALNRLQLEQEKHRSLHGLYADELSALQGVGVGSPQGRYVLALQLRGADGYGASATAQGAQTRDRDCPALTLEVQQGFARRGPSVACWNR